MLDYLSKNWTNSFGVLCTFYFLLSKEGKKIQRINSKFRFAHHCYIKAVRATQRSVESD